MIVQQIDRRTARPHRRGRRRQARRDFAGVQAARPRLWGYYYDPRHRGQLHPGRFRRGGGSTRGGSRSAKASPGCRLASGRGQHRSSRPTTGACSSSRSAEILSARVRPRLLGSRPVSRRRTSAACSGLRPGWRRTSCLSVRNARELPTIAVKIAEHASPTPGRSSGMISCGPTRPSSTGGGGMIVIILGGGLLAFVIFAWDKATGLSAPRRGGRSASSRPSAGRPRTSSS